jgi:hypothetical protein
VIELQTFVNRNASNLHEQSNKQALLAALRDRRASSRQALQSIDTPSLKIRLLQSQSSLAVTHSKLAYYSLVQEFHPRDQDGIFSGDRICRRKPAFSTVAVCIRSLLPFASFGSKVFDLSIFSVVALYFGKLKSNFDLIRLANSSYILALSEFRQHIDQVFLPPNGRSGRPGFKQSLLCINMALQLFEIISGTGLSGSGLQTHVDGSLQLLKLLNPLDFLAPPLRQFFGALRGLLVSCSQCLTFRC